MGKRIDLTGMVFGRLTVLRVADTKAKDNKYLYECICSCGNPDIIIKRGWSLSGGHTKSCGCLVLETNKARTGVPTKHGMTRTLLYTAWLNMKARCNNPNLACAHHYSERGITYPEKWEKFEGFFEDMGECPEGFTLNRKDVNLGYSKDNCEWVDYVKQGRDRRKPSTGISSKYKGVTFNKKTGKFTGRLVYKGISHYLGVSDSELEIALRYDAKVIEIVGQDGGTNYQLGLLPDEFYEEN
jgi:hypothetical protein